MVDYLRVVYSDYHAHSVNSRSDIGGLIQIGIIFKEQKLLQLLSKKDIFKPENVASLYVVAKANNLQQLEKESSTYLEQNFDVLVRSKDILAKWPKTLLKEYRTKLLDDFSTWCHFASWLDVLWFGHNTDNQKMKNKAVAKLTELLNVENVVPVLVASHITGLKELRSKCVDYMVLHATNVEEFQRMRMATAHTDKSALSEITAMSESLRTEVASLVKRQVNELKNVKSKKAKGFGKNRTCSLCRRTVDKTLMKNGVYLAPTFGFNKPKSVCPSCEQLNMMIAEEV